MLCFMNKELVRVKLNLTMFDWIVWKELNKEHILVTISYFFFIFYFFWFINFVIILFSFPILCGQKSVQVMGTFDGWCQGEHLSPEYTGSFTRFSTTLVLRPGR